jgi:hypothetical protein
LRLRLRLSNLLKRKRPKPLRLKARPPKKKLQPKKPPLKKLRLKKLKPQLGLSLTT